MVAASLIAAAAVGPVSIPLRTVVSILLGDASGNVSPMHRLIVSQLRLPRVLLGILVGSALAVSGTVMQGLFDNPLASPYVLGIASGASAGAAFVILFRTGSDFLLPMGAFLGATAAAAIVFGLGFGRNRPASTITLILSGVAVGSLFSAVTSLLLFLRSGGERLSDVLFWIMGGLARADWTAVAVLAPVTAVGIAVAQCLARDLNALSLGEEGAFHVGVNPSSLQRWLLACAILLTSTAVAVAGTIGFVGLIIPHLMRLVVGPDHRRLIPVAALAGGCFLVWSDALARTAFAPAELPVGVITAFLGAPFFLYLLRRRNTRLG